MPLNKRNQTKLNQIYCSTSYAAVVFSDFDVIYLREGESATFHLFLHRVLFMHNVA